jgi:glutamate-1-semialdehyde 2,1-aminomutase
VSVKEPLVKKNRITSEEMLDRAKRSVAGGDSSTMRVLPYHPALVIDRGEGCRIWDVDDNEYIDLNMAYGPLLFGHRPPFLMESVIEQLREKGSQLGFPQELNFLVAEKVKQLFPSIDLLRFANSGTEAVASAVRLARTFTGRRDIVLFEGHYHGWSDAVFHQYHAPLESFSDEPLRTAVASTGGMAGAPRDAYVVQWNDADALEDVLRRLDGKVAAVIMEPVMGNASVIPPGPGYLAAAREITRKHGALLIFDEVITGLRVAPGGAQQLYGVSPDITVISKALGGGFPVAAFGASAEIMALVAEGKVFHGGVYSGNALVLSAANAVLGLVMAEGDRLYAELNERAAQLTSGIEQILRRREIPHVVQHVGPMISVVLTQGHVDALTNYREVRRYADFDGYIRLQHGLLDRGVYVHPNQFEPLYLSTAHSEQDIEDVLERFDATIRQTLG